MLPDYVKELSQGVVDRREAALQNLITADNGRTDFYRGEVQAYQAVERLIATTLSSYEEGDDDE